MGNLTKRTQIYLTHEQWARVEAKANRIGVSAAEVVRRAVDAYCASPEDFRSAVRAASGAWRNRKLDAEAYVRGLREEWNTRPHG